MPPGPGLTVIARINLLARRGRVDGPDLKQCLAPDYVMVLEAGRATTLPAHDAQAVHALEIDRSLVASHGIQALALERSLGGEVISDGVLAGLVERIADPATGGPAHDQAMLGALIQGLTHRLEARAARPRLQAGLAPWQLARLRAFVEPRLGSPLSLDALAAEVGLSRFHFARMFKVSMGVAPATWIRFRRLTVASQMLRDPARSVEEIALAVGYAAPDRFTKAFKSFAGLTPSAFRRQLDQT